LLSVVFECLLLGTRPRRRRPTPAGALATLRRCTDFDARVAELEAPGLPSWGGIFLRQVSVNRDTMNRAIRPFLVPLVYSADPFDPDDQAGFQFVVRQKLQNVARTVWEYGQTRIIIGSPFARPAEVAEAIRDLLLDAQHDTHHLFERVVLALDPGEAERSIAARRALETAFGLRH
jgi:hypothetical protein